MASSKVKASERIRLSTGQVMTLGEALDAGFLVLKETTSYSRTKEDSRGRALAMTHYTAREKSGDFYWEIGRTLYESRSGLPVSAGGSRLEPNVRNGDTFDQMVRLSRDELPDKFIGEVEEIEAAGGVYIGIWQGFPAFVVPDDVRAVRVLRGWGYKSKTRKIDGKSAGSFWAQ